jgi:hypothetical protein
MDLLFCLKYFVGVRVLLLRGRHENRVYRLQHTV